MLKKNINLLLLIGILLAVCCTHEREVAPNNTGKRTLLVYLAGDNDLSSEVSEKKRSLLDGWSPNLGQLLVFSDTYSGTPVLTQAARHNGKSVWDTLRVYSETNSASPQLLRDVIGDTRQFAPAASYGMILFSHATGWLPQGAFNNPLAWHPQATRSLLKDGTREMELSDFKDAVPDGMFDFMVFDMCFMAGVEVAYALRGKTPFMVASATEILSPGFTPVYSTHLSSLYRSEADLKTFAGAFFDYFDAQEGQYRSATVSVIRTAETETLVQLIKELSPDLTQTEIDGIQHFDRKGKPHLFFDLGDFLHAAAKTDSRHHQIDDALGRAVVFKNQTSRLISIGILKHSGLSVYIPQEGLDKLNEAYKDTDFYRNCQR